MLINLRFGQSFQNSSFNLAFFNNAASKYKIIHGFLSQKLDFNAEKYEIIFYSV